MKTKNAPLRDIRRFKYFALALALGTGLSHAQTIIDVGGADFIGVDTLTTSGGVAKLPVGGDTWKTNGGTGNPVSTTLASPAVTVPANGNVTLTFTHRYDFETGWDGGAVFVSVDGAPAVYLAGSAFTSAGYVGTTTSNTSVAWAGGQEVFYGKSAGYDDDPPALITEEADLGFLTAGQTVSVEFKGEWDAAVTNGPPAWEIGSVKLTDAGDTDILDVDFDADGPSGFTVSSSDPAPAPWTYNSPVLRFELDADTTTADRIAPDIAGSEIDLNGATIDVVILTGEVEVNDTFSLFDLSGGTTLTGALASITLPPIGTWDTSELAAGGDGTITLLTSNLQDGTWIANAGGDWSDESKWLDEIIANGAGKTATINMTGTGNRTINVDDPRTIGNIARNWAINNQLTFAGSALTLAGTNPTITNNDPGLVRRIVISSQVLGSDGLNVDGGGFVWLTNNSSTWSGSTNVSDGFLDFGGININNIGGGSGRNISVAANAGVRFGPLTSAVLDRIEQTDDEISLVGAGGLNNYDLSITGADLPNAFLGHFAGNGAKSDYRGTITPASDNYRLGTPLGMNGLLGITNDSPMTGTQGLIIGGGGVELVGPKTFTGDTVIRTGGRLGLAAMAGSDAVAYGLQNSALDVGSAGGNFWLERNPAPSAPILGAVYTTSAVLGGLKGSRNLRVVYTLTTGVNNGAATPVAEITGFTLNPGEGMTHTYAGSIGGFGAGATGNTGGASTLTKTGAGTQIFEGVHTYTGATIIEEGTLALGASGSITSSTSLTIEPSGTLDVSAQSSYAIPASQPLTFGLDATNSGTIVADGLDIENAAVSFTGTTGAAVYVLATYTDLDGTAFNSVTVPTGYMLDYEYQGDKIALLATAGTPYTIWSGGAAFGDDENGDGVSNGLAFLLGAANPAANALGLLPTATETSGGLVLTFSMRNATERGAATMDVQWSNDLGITDLWTTNTAQVPETSSTVNDVVFVITPNGTLNDVVATIPATKAAAGKLFGRLSGEEN